MKRPGVRQTTSSTSRHKWDVRVLLWLVLALVGMVVVYSAVFLQLMAAEGQQHNWTDAIYWTLVTMSTLGFGDIVFEEAPGRLFSILVLFSGAIFVLVILPFAFIRFIFIPWIRQRESARAPRKLPEEVSDHIVLTQLDAITDALIKRAKQGGVDYVLLVDELDEALRLHDNGYRMMLGALDDPRTYSKARVAHAALVATTQADTTNTNIAFTVREQSTTVPVVATASSEASVDILELAGCDEVLRLGKMLGHALARRILGSDARSHVVGEFGALRIAEAAVKNTPLVGNTLRQANLRQRLSVNVVGVWQRGQFELATPDTELGEHTVLILAGSDAQLASYDRAFAVERTLESPVVIIGGGRVGRAAGVALDEAGVPHKIVEQRADRIRDQEKYIHGDAADRAALQRAGILDASAVLVTTHEDDMNIYLTLYCRRLRPDIQVISRSNLERNVSTLHRAGADAVLSYASLGATAIWNVLGHNRTLVLAEGLEVFRVPIPHAMAGRSLAESDIAQKTGCNVVATAQNGDMNPNPDMREPLPDDAELVIIGDQHAEQRFLERYPARRG